MFNQDDLNKLANMSDGLLKDKISIAVNSATGKDINLSENDIKKIRNIVLGMKAEDINNIISQFDETKVKNLKSILNDEK